MMPTLLISVPAGVWYLHDNPPHNQSHGTQKQTMALCDILSWTPMAYYMALK
jgi:hypothetical protein